jgi:hypothetical protein
MILVIFVIISIFMGICFLIGMSQQSFGFLYLGMGTMLILGLLLMSSGLDIDEGYKQLYEEDGKVVMVVYTNYSIEDDPLIFLLAFSMFLIPIPGILLTTYAAFNNR